MTISVASLIPGSTPAAIKQFNTQVSEFEKKNPTIKVKPVEYQWTAPTFAAKLAAGTLPTVFEVPFTDARTLGDHGQLANLTPYFKKLPYHKKYNKAVLAEGTDAKGQVIALPKGAYAQALHYNRALFQQAGLNPSKPPTTWAQVRKDARIDRPEDRQARLCRDGEERQHRRLDPDLGRLLARRAHGEGHRHPCQGDLNNKYTVQALNMLKAMRWTDNSMGSNFDLRLERHQPGVRRRPGRHVHQRLGRVHEPRAGVQRRSVHLRLAHDPARQEQERRRARRRHARRRPPEGEQGHSRRGHEVDRLLLRVAAVSKRQAIRNAKTLVANKQPVGVPALPLFNKTQYNLANTWIKPYINVPLGQMKPFLNGIFEPEAHPGARGIDPERLPRARRRRRGGADEPERGRRADAPAGERTRRRPRSQAGN